MRQELMPEVARQFADLLARERQAALRADVETLAALQDPKRELLIAMKVSGLDAHIVDELSACARANIVLMRHLVVCLRGAIEPPGEPTYTAKGEAKLAGERLVRAVL